MDNFNNKSSDSVEADFQKHLDGFIPILTQELGVFGVQCLSVVFFIAT